MTALFYISIFWLLAAALAYVMALARYMGTTNRRRASRFPVWFWEGLGAL